MHKSSIPNRIKAFFSLVVRIISESDSNHSNQQFEPCEESVSFVQQGDALARQGNHQAAIACFRKAISIDSDFAEAHLYLGNALEYLGHLNEAEASYRQTLESNPSNADAYNCLGTILLKLNRWGEAEVCFRHALQISSDQADTLNNLGVALQNTGRLVEAEASYRRAILINPRHDNAHNNLSAALLKSGRFAEAKAYCMKALELNRNNAHAHNNLGNSLRELGRIVEAEENFRRALQLNPKNADTHNNLGNALKDLGRFIEAEKSYRRALNVYPGFASAYSNLLFLYGYHAMLDSWKYLAHSRKWELACIPEQDRLAARSRSFQRAPLANRRLKVGYVSGDFRHHAVSSFIEQLFAHHDRTRIELFAYSNSVIHDAVTERLHKLTEHWIQITGLSDAIVRDRIEADGIDVLIDLSGHTAGNRLGVFARRAAPVQAYYLGYFASTGLSEMDYWIGDEIVTPPETDSHFSERVWRLPRVSWSYDGKDAPPPDWRPAPDGTVWLGSFNQLGKLTPATLALWAKVLHALPEGKLLLKTKELTDPLNRQRILDDLTSHGIAPDRIELQDGSSTPSWREHMAYYNRLDIVLDPVGAMGGVTSTCDALWMAVPVITMEGDRVASRATAALVNAIGHSEWNACSEAEYVQHVVALARDLELRVALRSSQREQMARSPLCDAKDLAKNLEDAYIQMFTRRFDGK